MDDCNHEEADPRIMVHIQHALEQRSESVLDSVSVNFQTLERLRVVLYDKWSIFFSVNETQKLLFCHVQWRIYPLLKRLVFNMLEVHCTNQVSGQAMQTRRLEIPMTMVVKTYCLNMGFSLDDHC